MVYMKLNFQIKLFLNNIRVTRKTQGATATFIRAGMHSAAFDEIGRKSTYCH